MIESFGDKETELIYNQIRSKKLPYDIQNRALIKLMMIDSAESENDLRVPISNNLEKLKGSFKNYWSIRINDQWRIIFRYDSGKANDVKIIDYH